METLVCGLSRTLVTDSHNRVIAVFLQYRLGAFGRFHPR
jgi:hypothetical protein